VTADAVPVPGARAGRGDPLSGRRTLRRLADRDSVIALVSLTWVPAVLLLDRGADIWSQRALGLATWALLLVLLRTETPLVRAQVAVVVVFATAVEYTFSPLLEVYVYRLDNVPAFVPPGHGLVYLCALALGRTDAFRRHRARLVAATVVAGGSYAGWGLLLSDRRDVLGAFWFLCLLGFLRWGRSVTLYVGAFLVVTYLEVLGTWIGTWEWQATDPTGLVAIGNPPSGAAGGYGWFDLAATLAAPTVLALTRRQGGDRRSSTSSCSKPFVASALPPAGPGVPPRSVKRPPASVTTIAGAARSCSATSGSHATSTAPSATSMYDQKSP
jgi:hypothetical protein